MLAKFRYAFLASTLLLAACGRGPSDGSATPTPAATPGKTAAGGLSVSPDSMRTCDAGKKMSTQLRWDVTGSGARDVVVTVQNPKTGEEKRFGHGKPVGVKQSGPWLRPGLVFRVRDNANGRELASATIKGIACH